MIALGLLPERYSHVKLEFELQRHNHHIFSKKIALKLFTIALNAYHDNKDYVTFFIDETFQ